jgi:hypothetical protein
VAASQFKKCNHQLKDSVGGGGVFEMRRYSGGTYGGEEYHLVWPSNQSTKINEGKKYVVALGGRQTTNENTTTNQKHAGLTGERQDMMRNQRGARWECKLIILGRSSWDSVKT